MFIASRLAWGLVCIHLFWIYFYVTGTLIRPRQHRASDLDDRQPTAPSALTDLVITTVTGMSITGFVMLIFGFIGLLSAGAFLLWLIIEGLLFKTVREENLLKRDFWLSRFKQIKRAWDLPALVIYAVFLVISVPAILPPVAWDAISYHLAYAVDWANAGYIYVDEFLRNPYYANNYLLLDTLLFVLKLGPVCHFMTWLCGLLTCLGVYSLIAQAKYGENSVGLARLDLSRAVIITLGLALSPVFLRWVNTAFMDVPLGLFVFIPILCTYIGLRGDARNYDLDFVLVAAFCVGIKISHFLFLPLFIVSLILLLRKSATSVRRMIALVSVLLILSAPWYVRNFIDTGDPITPTINMMVRGRDPVWSHQDYVTQLGDLMTAKDPVSLLRVPIDVVLNTTSRNFREYGTSPILMLLYVPLVMAPLLLLGKIRRRFGWPFVYLNCVLIYLLGYWVGISSFARYFLLPFPVYAAYMALWFNALVFYSVVHLKDKRVRIAASLVVTAGIVILMFYPTAMARTYYDDLVTSYYYELTNRFPSYSGFLRQNLPGYASTQYIIANQPDRDKKVMVVGFENLAYYFRRNRLTSFGDWFGIGRHSDLVDSVNTGNLSSYLAKFDVGAVMVNRREKRIDDETYLRFTKQLEENHFVLQPAQEYGTDIYIKAK
jgi:hypothetical protein